VWRPDIVHTHMAKAGAVGRLAALLYNRTRSRGARARLVHTYHGHVFEGYFGSPSTRIFLAVERWLARRTDVLIAISPRVKTDLIETYGIADEQQIRVIPLGFNLDRLLAITAADRLCAKASLQIPADAITITTVGRLTAIKQHSLFLEMARLLAQRPRRFIFLIAGDGELRGELEAQAAAAGIGDRTRFLGWRGDLETVYGATDIFVLTSRNEGTPVALIEAMAAGVASVSTDVGGVSDVITGPALGTLVPFGDAAALADAVVTLAGDESLRRGVGMAARTSVKERYHVRRLIEDITSLYWHLLENRGTLQ
jgi:glycosyltransferase involved in cell wall biosynthesis